MPIRREERWFYPIDWAELSAHVRFVRARGRCQHCGRPHGATVKALPDGRWFDEEASFWRAPLGQAAEHPDVVAYARHKLTRVVLACCHLDHDPTNNALANLAALCQRCHLLHDQSHHLKQYRITIRLRRALGDLFDGPYRRW